MKTEIQETELYKKFKKALNITETWPEDNPFVVACCKVADEYASQFQQELPNVKDIVKKFIDSDEPDTFIRNEHGVLMYYSHDKQSGINLESYFEDLVQYVFDEMSAKSPQPYNPKQS